MRACLLVCLLVSWTTTSSFAQVTAADKDKDKAPDKVEMAMARKMITIEVTNAAIDEVLKLLFEQAKEKGVFPHNEATARKLTAILKEIPFESALSLVANAGGLKVEKRDGGWALSLSGPQGLLGGVGYGVSGHGGMPMVFVCPSCSKSVTILQKQPGKSAACGKCNRPQQPEWEFCPSCGAKRASEESGISFCPFCGKPAKVELKKAELDSVIELVRQLESPLNTPVVRAGRVAAKLADEAHAKGHPWIGVQLMDITADHKKDLALPDTRGALVLEVQKDSPAAAAGLRKNDVIVAVDNKPVTSTEEAVLRIRAYRPNETAALTVRRERKMIAIRVQVGDPDSSGRNLPKPSQEVQP